MRAVLSLGSNMEDRYGHLESVYQHFRQELVCASRIYSTPAWGVTDQSDFLNAIMIVEVAQTARELLHRCQELEQHAKRRRTQHWGPRTLDIDLIQVTDVDTRHYVYSDDEELVLPHPWAAQRAFVIVPWYELDPEAHLAQRPLREIIAQLRSSAPEDMAAITPCAYFASEEPQKESRESRESDR
ncbi:MULTISPECIES: 2-amino-4-hydroxy-6-hydroxymethyldihydropteridine diphosphokinase [unclassified Corynebacterium]|uniref:2-amino-4-hydroxy-6- hydroxymethyldihydropteridine diphosphokinase n=1 Tax=unclassified Corynebacterium TaxID=2624378 RepID=UPI00163D450C|nr:MULTISPECIES: 2-amino-4-hydroxy-6-hydroxymethyldihydropteridine diphosphokinase [unclassified Corynebacterium]